MSQLFGLALIYGVTGAVHIDILVQRLPAMMGQPVVVTGLLLTLAGFFFKLAVFPFHFWAPEAYQGAPNQVAAFIAAVSKVAAVAILLRMIAMAQGNSDLLARGLIAMAVISMTVGNLAAIARSLNVDDELYIMTHTAELVIGALILLFLITGAKPFFGLWLKPYNSEENKSEQPDINVADFESYEGFFKRDNFLPALKAFGIAVVIFGIGYGLTYLFKGEAKDTVAVLTVTTLGIGASLIPSVNRIKSSFQLGMYFIYVFCVIVASKADIVSLFSTENIGLLTNLLLYITLVIVGSLLLHALLSRIFGINIDDFIITSTALSNSPPFVPVVAAAIRNKEVVVPGMIIGVIGYAIGNYLGVAIAYLLK